MKIVKMKTKSYGDKPMLGPGEEISHRVTDKGITTFYITERKDWKRITELKGNIKAFFEEEGVF